jgi:hypothetical protein
MNLASTTAAMLDSSTPGPNIPLNAVCQISGCGHVNWLTLLDCGNSLAAGAGPLPSSDCYMTCTGNATEACGGPNALNLFWSGNLGPQTNPGVNGWQFSGCYTLVESDEWDEKDLELTSGL